MGAGRDEAFTAFVRDRGPALARSAYLLCGDPGRAEDLLQTALTATYLRWHTLRDPAKADVYVRRVLATTHAGWHRLRRSSEVCLADIPELPGTDGTDDLVQRRVLLEALQQLPARQRAALVLRFYDDLSEAAVAQILGCSTGAVKRHTHRGLARLRTLLGAAAGVPEEVP